VVRGWDEAPLGAGDVELTAAGSRFRHGDARFDVPLPGLHNARNAHCAARLVERLGFAPAEIARALAGFRGLSRRLEVVGSAGGVTVIDDYAHNPAKIRAAWEALAPHHRRVCAVWRPHGYAPLAKPMDSLTAVFSDLVGAGHRLILLPVYDAGGTADRSVDSGMLAERLPADGSVRCVQTADEAVGAAAAAVGPGDAVLIMGARDPGLPALARGIAARLATGERGQGCPRYGGEAKGL
jgi:UDP-N-acetylmuramate--alanine ligase